MAGRPRTRKNLWGESGPPAPEHNRRRMTHGGLVTRRSHGGEMAAKEAEIMEALADAAPVRAADGGLPSHDIFAVRLLAMEWVRLENMTAYTHDHGLLDEYGEPRQPLVDMIGKSADRIARSWTRWA